MSKKDNTTPSSGHIDADAPDRQAILDLLEDHGLPLQRDRKSVV